MNVEIEENSELDLFEAFNKHEGDERIPGVVADMEKELGAGNKKPEILAKLAQYELTLLDWIEMTAKTIKKRINIQRTQDSLLPLLLKTVRLFI